MAGMKGELLLSSEVSGTSVPVVDSPDGNIVPVIYFSRILIISYVFIVSCTRLFSSFVFIALLTLAFMGSIGMTFLIIACVIYACWWPMVVVVFYFLLPLPTMIARRAQMNYGSQGQPCMDLAIFLSMGLIVSSFALPIVFARAPSPVIEPEACYLTLIGNVVIYFTFIGFSMLFKDEASYNSW